MRSHGADHRATTPIRAFLLSRVDFLAICFLILATPWQPANSQEPGTASISDSALLSAEQVVNNLVQMNLRRAQALHAYQGTRTYRVEYHGVLGVRSAEMVVNAKHQPPEKMEFVVRSTTGSKLIINKVFKKLLEAEREESSPEIARSSALNDENYRFTLIGNKGGFSRATYVLAVEPRRVDKFLFRGRIWVDAADFAVVRLEVEPSKNPSFWTRNADVTLVYTKVSDFWLPEYNHSVSTIRLGGHADLTINYKGYEIKDASQVSSLSKLGSTLHAEDDHAQE
jgi:hypothetical protein